MRRNVLLCAMGVVCAPAVLAAGVEVHEEAIRVQFVNHSARIEFEVAAERAGRAKVTAEWLDPQERVVGRGSTHVKLRAGEQSLRVSTGSPIAPYNSSSNEALGLALRLRYAVDAEGEPHIERIVSLSEMRSNYVVLAPKVPESASRSHPLRFLVRALDPLGFAQAGVTVTASVRFTEKGKPVVQTVNVDASGKASFEFPWPAKEGADELDEVKVELEAVSGDVRRRALVSIDVETKPTLYVSTDKALYQPGQTLHMRAIAFDDENRAVKGGELEFGVFKTFADVLYKTTVTASRFGVAAADWTIPESAETGDYSVEIKTSSMAESVRRPFRIARYELPTFEFTAVPVRSNAKPGETVAVSIDAKYLHGAPLKSGVVKITGKGNRYWISGGWQSVDPGVFVGKLDARGHAVIPVQVPEMTAEALRWTWTLTYSVMVTEPDTQREEERTFPLTLGEGGIQMTLAPALLSRGLARPLYVRAKYWSGGVCTECTIEVREYSAKHENGGVRKGPERLVATVRTNSLGVAVVPEYQTSQPEEWAEQIVLLLRASDKSGRSGQQVEWLKAEGEAKREGRIELQKVLHQPGEPVRLMIESPNEDGKVLVAVVRQSQTLDIFQTALHNGRAEIEYSYQPEFGEKVTFVLSAADGEAQVLDQVTAFYRTVQPLQVKVKMDREQYRPGETVKAQIEVRSVEGKAVEAAIGASAIDRAVILRERGAYQNRSDGEAPFDDQSWVAQLEAKRPVNAEQDSLLRFLSHQEPYWQDSLNFDFELNVPFQSAFQEWLIARLTPYRRAVDAALADDEKVPVNDEELLALWKRRGLDFVGLLDPWGQRFELSCEPGRREIHCFVKSPGPRGRGARGDGLTFDLFQLNWFARQSARLRVQLQKPGTVFPWSLDEFDALWKAAGLTDSDRLDPDGKRIAVEFSLLPNFGEAAYIYGRYDPKAARRDASYRGVQQIVITSSYAGYRTQVASFAGTFRGKGKEASAEEFRKSGKSGIAGSVTDPSGAFVPNALVTIKDPNTNQSLTIRAGPSGEFVFYGVPVGLYDVSAESPGFATFHLTRVPVTDLILTPLTIVLQVGSVSSAVTVEAATSPLMVESAMTMTSTESGSGEDEPEPRLRKEFLETLLWRPMIETDRHGRATVEFPLADNITTWAFTAVGSTMNGQMASGEAEIRAFQPFFIEHAPPPVLTEGDEVWLPVLLRSYLKTDQAVTLRTDAAGWFELKNPAESALTVPAGGAVKQTLHFTATHAVKEGAQRITALGGTGGESDAIEKKVEVRPPGHRTESTITEVFSGEESSLVIELPQGATAIEGRLRLRPDASSHIFTAQAAMLQKPYGCGEQTISSTFPSLLIVSRGDAPPADLAKAKRYLRLGYDRLLSYRMADGGFAYFQGQGADVAITAYAIEFLTAAANVMEVDAAVIRDAGTWLEKQQNADGTWGSRYEKSDARATAYVAHVLASSIGQKLNRKALERVTPFLAGLTGAEDAYLQSQILGVLRTMGDARAEESKATLVKLVQTERRGGLRWEPGGLTPFYGWGRAGSIETTSMVALALLEAGEDKLARQGLAYLLRNQDSMGSWHSTQATIRALQALLAFPAPRVQGDAALQATLNGEPVRDGVIRLRPGTNELRLNSISAGSLAAASVSAVSYVPWAQVPVTATGDVKAAIAFDRTSAAVGEAIECIVRWGRSDGRHYGMVIAEVGLPPGAEVDRSSLEGDPNISRFEVQPDRVVLYLWKYSSGDQTIRFRFRARFPMKAWQAESVLYDYYNPDARVVVAPVQFEIGGGPARE